MQSQPAESWHALIGGCQALPHKAHDIIGLPEAAGQSPMASALLGMAHGLGTNLPIINEDNISTESGYVNFQASRVRILIGTCSNECCLAVKSRRAWRLRHF